MSLTNEVNEELNPSELGSKEYWLKVYSEEIENFKQHGDEGEIWFGEETVQRLLRWLTSSRLVFKQDSILDIGCGNGNLLIELSKEGFEKLYGIDYCIDAIELAKQVSQKHEQNNIIFKVDDILKEDYRDHFKIVLDKGTYDAISLNKDDVKFKRMKYKKNVCKLLEPGGLFIITSCNWTGEELINYFDPDLKKIHEIPSPKFTFGGKSGNSTVSIVFRKE